MDNYSLESTGIANENEESITKIPPKKKSKLKTILPIIVAIVLIGAALLYFFVIRINVKPQYDTVIEGEFEAAMLTEDGTVIKCRLSGSTTEITDGWDDVIEIKCNSLADYTGGDAVDTISLSWGSHCIGLTEDGSVKIISSSTYDEEENENMHEKIDKFENIEDIAATWSNLYFLTKDGTVEVIDLRKAIGMEDEEITKINKKIKRLEDVAAIEANEHTFVAIKKDGTVAAFDSEGHEPSDYKTRKINKWEDIEKIKMTNVSVIGIRKNGTLVCEGDVNEDMLESWTGIKDLSADGSVGVKSNGKLVTTLNIDTDDLKNIEKVYYFNATIVGVKKDGSKVVKTFPQITTDTAYYEKIKAN